LQLFGAWLHLCFPDSELSKSTIEFLKGNKGEVNIKDGVLKAIVPEMMQLGYPRGQLLSDNWFLYPSEHWDCIQNEVNQALNDEDNYRVFAKIVNSA
jgi:hypothetical protein